MIINDKQLMQLINIATIASTSIFFKDQYKNSICDLLNEITNQQLIDMREIK